MKKILAVDDSPSMRQMVAYTLRDAGFDVEEAEDGQVALDKAKSNAYSLVLADVNMPNMDGITLVRQLRGLDSYKFTPLLILTTEAGADKKAEGKQAGATGNDHHMHLGIGDPVRYQCPHQIHIVRQDPARHQVVAGLDHAVLQKLPGGVLFRPTSIGHGQQGNVKGFHLGAGYTAHGRAPDSLKSGYTPVSPSQPFNGRE